MTANMQVNSWSCLHIQMIVIDGTSCTPLQYMAKYPYVLILSLQFLVASMHGEMDLDSKIIICSSNEKV